MRRAMSKIMPSAKFLADGETNQTPGSNDDFYLVLDDPHRLWLPGDEVLGQVILVSKKNLVNPTITLSLIGYVRVNATPHSKFRPVKHSLFDHTIQIYGEGGLYAGEHRFPFIVKLPNKRIYTSIDFGKGVIGYLLCTNMENNHSSQRSYEKPINLISPIDVGSLPPPKPKRVAIREPKQLNRLSRTHSTTLERTYSSVSLGGLEDNAVGAAHIHPGTPNPSNAHSQSNGNSFIYNTAANGQHINNSIHLSRSNQNQTSPNSQTNTQTRQGQSPSFNISTNQQSQQQSQSSNSPDSTSSGTIQEPVYAGHLQPNLNHAESINTDRETRNESIDRLGLPDRRNERSNSGSFGNVVFSPGVHPTNSTNSHPTFSPDSSSTSESRTASAIRVSLEVPHRGYLRGEQIPVKLRVHHLRKVQDLNGVIVTFVRVCRLENGNSVPESFRKDLHQLIVPLYVDPTTLTADVTTNVRVPADAFPTIAGCPLVTFQYFIEVLVNLSGKSLLIDENNSEKPRDEKSGFVNTDKYKRSKKFLQLTTEVIIGTHRSNIRTHAVHSTTVLNTNNSPGMATSLPAVTNSPSINGNSPTGYGSSPVPVGYGNSPHADSPPVPTGYGNSPIPADVVVANHERDTANSAVPRVPTSTAEAPLGGRAEVPYGNAPDFPYGTPSTVGASGTSGWTGANTMAPSSLVENPAESSMTPLYTPREEHYDMPPGHGYDMSALLETPEYPGDHGRLSEKERMRAHEASLLPSNPEGVEEESPMAAVPEEETNETPQNEEYGFFEREETDV